MHDHYYKQLTFRWFYLLLGISAMLFAGIIYAWSILKAPLEKEFGWLGAQLSMNYTLTMCFFCLGTFVGGLVLKRLGARITIFIFGLLACSGFIFSSRLSGTSITMLYLNYGILAGFGIGGAYISILSTVTSWFPDKNGLCTGFLLMGFGGSTMILGNLANTFISSPEIGWRTTYMVIGLAMGILFLLSGLILRSPADEITASFQSKCPADPQKKNYTTKEMVRRSSFWKAFFCITLFASVGNSVLGIARDLAVAAGASGQLAAFLVGIVALFNGLGRIATGALYDKAGRRITMISGNILAITAALIMLLSQLLESLPLCILGLCFIGIACGVGPTVASAFTADFYGKKYYSTNFAIMNIHLIGASSMATVSSAIAAATGGFVISFLILLAMAIAALFFNISIKSP